MQSTKWVKKVVKNLYLPSNSSPSRGGGGVRFEICFLTRDLITSKYPPPQNETAYGELKKFWNLRSDHLKVSPPPPPELKLLMENLK